ncbi:neutral cholesterol ester hydrolase 1-like [Saccoglossus kowalevskii]|uniref:Neutral cholesterol ester hydrolase 1-like n=1 Tax=Saccoglossus kowalevskii TaxID=10224 RepID=A0ABM0GPX6_SACKO|nr:PREDICTED: neutral cholesterol ester hydrolase 1-like [Saccoglossus kowalevskii]
MKLYWCLAFGVLFAYYTYCPMPDGLAEPMKLRIVFASRQIIKLVGIGAVLSGYTDRISFSRSVIEFEQGLLSLSCSDEPNITFQDEIFDGVRVRVYQPVEKSDKPIAGMVYVHGGGWVVGSVDSYHYQTNYIAARLGIVLVSVDYRLAPEHPFPVPLQDVVKATIWFLQNAKDYNVDPERIAVVGDSAGGNLAAATASLLTFQEKYKQMNLPKLKFQGLIYPCLQSLDFLTPSYQQNKNLFILNQHLMVEFWSWYLTGHLKYVAAMKVNNHTSPQVKDNERKIMGHDQIPTELKKRDYIPPTDFNFGNIGIFTSIQNHLLNPSFAPLMRSIVTGLPSAYIVTAEFDVLRDDGIFYVKKLEDANVPVTWKHYEHGYHGIFSVFKGPIASEVGRQSMDDFLRFCRENL